MSTPHDSQKPTETASIWTDEGTAYWLRLRSKTFYNADYFERIVLPLMDLPDSAQVLDVGCGYGGLSLLLAEQRPNLRITGVDKEASALESAANSARQKGLTNIAFEQGDGQQLKYDDNLFDAVLCQTVLTHVPDAQRVIREMARVLRPGGLFMAAEYTSTGAALSYTSVEDSKRDENWYQKFFLLSRLLMKGKRALGRGDDSVGIRVPLLATRAGLDVFDVRLNDRVSHVIPPYRHAKQGDYLDLLKPPPTKPDAEDKGLAQQIETFRAAGGTAEDADWLYRATDWAAVHQAVEDRTLTDISAYLLFLTFARKP